MSNPMRTIEDITDNIRHMLQSTEEDIDDINPIQLLQTLAENDDGYIIVNESEFVPKYRNINTLQKKRKELYDDAYGLDGSTTRVLRFNNGFMMVLSIAKASSLYTYDTETISNKYSISVVTYHDTIDTSLDSFRNKENEDIKMHSFSYPNTSGDENIPNVMTTLSLMKSESQHLKKILSDDNIISSGPIFTDGPIYPSNVLVWNIYQDQHRSFVENEKIKREVRSILSDIVEALKVCFQKQIPIYGVQKTTQSTRLQKAIKQKNPNKENDIIWKSDSAMVNAFLDYQNKKNKIAYTPWYTEDRVDVGDGELVKPFDAIDDIDIMPFSPRDLDRKYFYAKKTNQNNVFRFGVPRFVEKYTEYTLQDIQNIALCDLSLGKKQPKSIQTADDSIRITKKLRNDIRKRIGVRSNIDFNKQREYK